jgi:hypothetical protein
MVHLQRFADEPAQPATLLDCYKRIRSATGNKFSSDHDFFSALCEAAALLANNLTYLMACTRNPFYDYNLEQVHARAIRAETVLASLGKREDVIAGAAEFIGILVALQSSGYRDYLGELFHSLGKREDVIAGAAEFIGILVALQSSGYRDYLGELFHSLELHNSDRGQFFTPHSISTLLGGMTMSTEEVRQRLYDCDDYIEVADGCGCGAGSMLLGALSHVSPLYHRNMLLTGVDVDPRCIHMCVVQFFAVPAPTCFFHYDGLLLTPQSQYPVWANPSYFIQSMRLRAKRKHEREARSLATAGGHVNQLRAILRANLGGF